MSIKRYSATKDATITNAYNDGLKVRAVRSNMGASDSLEIFSLYGRASEFESEKSRILVYFPMEQIVQDRQDLKIGFSGSAQFVFKLSNLENRSSTPSKFTLVINPVSGSWDEGVGIDMDSYKDEGSVNWLSASDGKRWNNEGGDYYPEFEVSKYFENGVEDLEVDITDIVEQWITGSLDNNGLLIRLSSSFEDGTESYYTKKFSSRSSEYFFKRPWIEVRTDSSTKDDRGKFFSYNRFVPIEENYNTLCIYNRYRGQLFNFPQIGTGSIYVALYNTMKAPLPPPLNLITGSTENPESILFATGSYVSPGVYKCDICINTNEETVYDFWYNEDRSFLAIGGPITVRSPYKVTREVEDQFIFSIKNLKQVYSNNEESVIEVFTRNKTWNPNSYTSMQEQQNLFFPDNLYYKVYRIVDDYEVIPYGTGSYNHTRLSRDQKASYFSLDFAMFESGYAYAIKFLYKEKTRFSEAKELFKFRVE